MTTAASQARPGARASRLSVGIAGAAVVLALVGVVWATRGRTPVQSAPSTRPTPTAPRLPSGVLASTAPEANGDYERYQLIALSRLDLPEMRRMLERALEIDPQFADARGEYGFALALELIGGWSNDATLLNRAEEQIRRALQDDPRSGRAHSALAAVYYTEGRMDLVEGEVVQALQANPIDVAAFGWLQNTHMIKGDYERAKDVARKALAINPNFFPVRMVNGEVLQNAGDLAASISEREKVVEQAPANLVGIRSLSRGYIVVGELAKARQLLERAAPGARTNLSTSGSSAAQLLASEGKRAEALREMDESLQKYRRGGLAALRGNRRGLRDTRRHRHGTRLAGPRRSRRQRAGRVVPAQSSAGEHPAAAALQADRRVQSRIAEARGRHRPARNAVRLTCYRCSSNMLRL